MEDRKKILVIDDDRTITTLLKTRLGAMGYDVVTAADGEEGLKLATAHRPDLVILDILMPKMDGYTFLLEYKKIVDIRQNPVIVLSAKDNFQDIFRMEGVNDYIVKPFEMQDLLGKIQKHLNTPNKRILVADDATEVVQLIESMLSDRGYRVMSAANGFDALGVAKREIPDLMILDVMMPKLDGYRVCRILKYDAKYKNIAVVMLSAKTEENDRLLGREVGADVYLAKPFHGDRLLHTLKELLWD